MSENWESRERKGIKRTKKIEWENKQKKLKWKVEWESWVNRKVE